MIVLFLKARAVRDDYTGDLSGFDIPLPPDGWVANNEHEGKFWIGYYHGRTPRDAPLPD